MMISAWTNQFRQLLHVAASWLLDTLRRCLSAMHVEPVQLGTLRLPLLTISGRDWQWSDRARLRPASYPGQPLWDRLAAYCRLHE